MIHSGFPRRCALMTSFLLTLAAPSGCSVRDGGPAAKAASAPVPPAPVPPARAPSWGLVLHGGASNIDPEMLALERQAAYRVTLEEALRAGHHVLEEGGESVDAVVAAITVLEDSSLFNAGKGAVFNHDGKNELDAAIMDGSLQAAGAVAGVHRVKNPIVLAQRVMAKSPHVMLIGDGAEEFAKTQGVELVDSEGHVATPTLDTVPVPTITVVVDQYHVVRERIAYTVRARVERAGRIQRLFEAAFGRYVRDRKTALEVDRLQGEGHLQLAAVRDPGLVLGGQPVRVQATPGRCRRRPISAAAMGRVESRGAP